MKHLLIYLVTFFSYSLLHAQEEWAPVGAKWHYSFDHDLSSGYIAIEYVDDTLIAGNNCKVLQKTRFGYTSPGYFDTVDIGKEYVYSDSNVVYYYRYNKFYVLYDFDAEVGESWEIAGTNEFVSSGCDSVAQVIVESIGQLVLNGDTLRQLFISGTDSSHWVLSGSIVERIGSLGYMFPEMSMCLLGVSEGGPLRCYEDSLWGMYKPATSCTYIPTYVKEHAANELEYLVYPNPTSEKVFIRSLVPNEKPRTLSILNIYGQEIVRQALIGSNTTVSLGMLQSGLYVLKIHGDDRIITIKIQKL